MKTYHNFLNKDYHSFFALKSNTSISFGDQVRHPKYPEWGTGAVTKVEQTAIDWNPATRVSVRFKNAGLKTFAGNTLPVEVLVSDYVMPGDQDISRPAIAEVEDLEETERGDGGFGSTGGK